MRSERLFRILGLVDGDLIAEAGAFAPARRQMPWRRVLAACACLAVVCGAGLALRSTVGGGASGNAPTGDAGGGIVHGSEPLPAEGTAFMSYAGPVFPLTTAEADTGLTAERKTTWDFAPGTFSDGSPRQWGAAVTDAYTLTNPTEADVTVTALYPFAGSFSELAALLPTVTVDGAKAEGTLYAGAYAGGFRGTSAGDGSTWNLESPASWADYKALLEDGSYLSQTLGDAPALDIPATVYVFSDFEAPHEEYGAATQAVEFTIDRERTTILSYGFNGMSWDEDSGWRQYSYFVPDGVRRAPEKKVLVVLGEDIGDYTLSGYENGGCEQEIDGVSCTVTRTETTLDAVLDALCRDYLYEAFGAGRQYGLEDSEVEAIPYPLFRRAVAELLAQYGVLAGGGGMDRYSDGRLDDIISETLAQERVLYLAVPVTVPAGGSVDITFELWKEPSFDFGCSGSENVGLQGYDLVTALGSALDFTSQTAALANTDGIEIVRQNLDFDLENGVTAAVLEPEQAHYYLEVRPLA